jgi:diguanylate cyclase (GGDEF)-like protein
VSSRFSFEPRVRGAFHVIQVWGLPAMVAVLLASMWVMVVTVSSAQRGHLIEESQRELTQLNNAVTAHAAGTFSMVETSLRVIERWLREHPGSNPRSDPRLAALVSEIRNTSGGLIDPRLVSQRGEAFSLPQAAGATGLDVSDRDFFRHQLARPERRLHIGHAVKDRVSGQWVVPVSLRLSVASGGVFLVVANLDLTRLSAQHELMRLQPNGGIVLLRADGIVLSRAPFDESRIGMDLSKSSSYTSEYGVMPRGAFLSDGRDSDGVSRLVAYQRLNDYPVTVVVHRALGDVLSVSNQRRDIVISVVAVLTLLAAVFTWVLFRSQRALREAQQHLEQLEATDSLTGVMSRRAFLDAAQREFNRARRYARPTAVLLLDFDHFKNVNDSYGHAAGDEVLRKSAAASKLVLREQDLLGRIGGEEFCVVLPETASNPALHAAQRLRHAVSELRFPAGRGEAFGVTMSIGVAMVTHEDEDFAHVMARADQALYLAKARGRDRVEGPEEPRLTLVGGGRDKPGIHQGASKE